MDKKGFNIFAKRFFSSIVLLFIVVTIVFFIIQIAPGSPANRYLSPRLSPELLEKLQDYYAFEGSLFEQYIYYIKNIITADFGYSFTYNVKVTEVIARFIPLTLLLAFLALLLQTLVSVLFVYFSYEKAKIKETLNKISFFVFTIPSYVAGLLLILFFAVFAGILPISGMPTQTNAGISDYFLHLILPVVTLSLSGIALFYNYLASSVEKIKNTDYVLFAKSLGLSRHQLFFRHILPNAVIPLLSIIAIEAGFLLSGSLIIEVLFSLPGFGKLTYIAFTDRDYPLIIGTTLLSAFFMIFANFLADMFKYYFDKRYRELI